MSRSGWLILGAIFVVVFGGAAGAMAVMLFSSVEPPPKQPPVEIFGDADTPPGWDDVPPPPRIEPELRAAPEASVARRLAALEAEVTRLREELASERAKTKPLRDLYEQAEKAGLEPGAFEAGGPGPVLVDGPDHGAPLAKHLATKFLGLDEARAKAFGEAYEQWLARVEELEKQHAEVKVNGDTTTITIGRFGADGDDLRRRWDDHVAGTLSADEKQAYDKQGVRNRLFGGRTGRMARTVTIAERDGMVEVQDVGTDEGGGETQQVMKGPAMARDLMLRDYAHLLK